MFPVLATASPPQVRFCSPAPFQFDDLHPSRVLPLPFLSLSGLLLDPSISSSILEAHAHLLSMCSSAEACAAGFVSEEQQLKEAQMEHGGILRDQEGNLAIDPDLHIPPCLVTARSGEQRLRGNSETPDTSGGVGLT